MTVKRQLSFVVNGLVVFAKALLIAWVLMFLAEHFGWHLFREAGGSVVRTVVGGPSIHSPIDTVSRGEPPNTAQVLSSLKFSFTVSIAHATISVQGFENAGLF